jgi:hypothetical protein
MPDPADNSGIDNGYVNIVEQHQNKHAGSSGLQLSSAHEVMMMTAFGEWLSKFTNGIDTEITMRESKNLALRFAENWSLNCRSPSPKWIVTKFHEYLKKIHPSFVLPGQYKFTVEERQHLDALFANEDWQRGGGAIDLQRLAASTAELITAARRKIHSAAPSVDGSSVLNRRQGFRRQRSTQGVLADVPVPPQPVIVHCFQQQVRERLDAYVSSFPDARIAAEIHAAIHDSLFVAEYTEQFCLLFEKLLHFAKRCVETTAEHYIFARQADMQFGYLVFGVRPQDPAMHYAYQLRCVVGRLHRRGIGYVYQDTPRHILHCDVNSRLVLHVHRILAECAWTGIAVAYETTRHSSQCDANDHVVYSDSIVDGDSVLFAEEVARLDQVLAWDPQLFDHLYANDLLDANDTPSNVQGSDLPPGEVDADDDFDPENDSLLPFFGHLDFHSVMSLYNMFGYAIKYAFYELKMHEKYARTGDESRREGLAKVGAAFVASRDEIARDRLSFKTRMTSTFGGLTFASPQFFKAVAFPAAALVYLVINHVPDTATMNRVVALCASPQVVPWFYERIDDFLNACDVLVGDLVDLRVKLARRIVKHFLRRCCAELSSRVVEAAVKLHSCRR